MSGTQNLEGTQRGARKLRNTIQLAWAVALVLAARLAGAVEGPTVRALQSAAGMPLGADLEAQSAAAGAPFAGNHGGPTFSDSLRGGDKVAPKLTGSRPSSLKAKGDVPLPVSEKEEKALKLTRAVGLGAAAAGLGLMGYAVLAATSGPVGWAAALLFFGGMAAYLSHRRLKGEDDFGPRR